MPAGQPAKLLRIHCSEGDRYKGRPLHEAVVDRCRELKIAGATVFRGLQGFGESAEIHRSHLLGHDRPVVIAIVDSEQSVERLIPLIEEMMDTGMIAVSAVTALRIQKSTVAS